MHSFSLIQSSRLLSHIIIEPHSWTQPGAERQFSQLYTDIGLHVRWLLVTTSLNLIRVTTNKTESDYRVN